MSDPTYVVVPVNLHALYIDSGNLKEFQSSAAASLHYVALETFGSAEPQPFDDLQPFTPGVYLMWDLPAALKQGVQNNTTGTTTFPFVPNRWLVVRYSGPPAARVATAWMVQSDYLDPLNGTSSFLQPQAATLTPTLLGQAVPITAESPWIEPVPAAAAFLTAIAPGVETFSVYQPYNLNVFSMVDPLTDTDTADPLSYMVAGWYCTDPSADPLAVTDVEEALEQLQWDIAGGETVSSPAASVYFGMVHTLTAGQPPAIPSATDVTVAVGNTSIDALTALVASQSAGSKPSLEPWLLQALQYNLLPVMDQPDAEIQLEQSIRQAWFSSVPGGYFWNVVPSPSAKSYPDPGQYGEALAALNRAQAGYDNAARNLSSLQRKLYQFWWKMNALQTNHLDYAQYEPYLDPSDKGKLAYQVAQEMDHVAALQTKIPWGETAEELQSAIGEYTVSIGLPPSLTLQRSADVHFHQAGNPVVLLTGTSSQSVAGSALTALQCRLVSQFVSGLELPTGGIYASSMNGMIPMPNLQNLPPCVSSLVGEFFFLDPNNAGMIALAALLPASVIQAAQEGFLVLGALGQRPVLPAFPLGAWSQPWLPLLLLWGVNYYPTQYRDWTFDGEDYSWSGLQPDPPLPFQGRILLSPHAVLNLQSALAAWMQNDPSAPLEAIEQFIASTDQWDILSQSLDGLHQQLSLLDPLCNCAPQGEVAPLIGTAADYAVAGDFPSIGNSSGQYQVCRGGHLQFVQLWVADRFGQALAVYESSVALRNSLPGGGQAVVEVDPESTPAPIISPPLQTEHDVGSVNKDTIVELAPRLLQPARLRFDFVDATDDAKVLGFDSSVNPICAWVLPNNIDRSLMCYAPSGQALGELRNTVDLKGQTVTTWSALQFSDFPAIDSLAHRFPHLGQFLRGLSAAGARAFDSIFTAIDESLWTIQPLTGWSDQGLSVLVGRPLAMIRTRLQYQLCGLPILNPSYQTSFDPPDPVFTSYDFPIRLGYRGMMDDGLIGYFNGSDYEVFNAVCSPAVSSQYVLPIGSQRILPDDPLPYANWIYLQFGEANTAYVTMLVDPRASVHAVSGILPMASVTIAPQFVAAALSKICVSFRVGPLLTASRPAKSGVPSVAMPQPPPRDGTWSWAQEVEFAWQSFPISQATSVATFTTAPLKIRSGMLQLSGAFAKGTK